MMRPFTHASPALIAAVVIWACGHGTRTENTMSSEADQRAAELSDPDPRTRSRAARELLRLGDARALDACLLTLDDDPDPGHNERTPSVACLIQIGRPAITPAIEKLSAP